MQDTGDPESALAMATRSCIAWACRQSLPTAGVLAVAASASRLRKHRRYLELPTLERCGVRVGVRESAPSIPLGWGRASLAQHSLLIEAPAQQAISADRDRGGLRRAEASSLGRRWFTPFGRGGRSL